MHTGYVERSNGMAAREKRSLDPSSSHEGQPDRKRPALASVIVEALKVDSLQKLCSSLEPILRRVVSEEVERALAKLGPAKLNGRVSPKRIEGPDGRNLQLQFRSKLSLPLFTGGKVEGEQGAAIHVVLIDANTGHVVTSGPESSVKLDIVVLEGDFNNEDDEGWSQEEFESHIVREREGKRPLLTGDLQVTLKEGVGTLGELTFTDNSSWIRSRKFRLGLRVASGSCEGFRIREAKKTDAFTVKDHRGECKLIFVQDARGNVISLMILGSGMSNKMWEVLVEHSKTCVLSGKLYVYYPDEPRNVGVVFNDIYVLSGLIAGGQYHSVDSLSESHKVFVDTLVKKAYENWMHVIEYDGKSLLGFDQSYNDNSVSRYPTQPQNMNLNVSIQLDGASFTAQNQLINSVQQAEPSGSENVLALGPPHSTTPSFPTGGTLNLTSYRGFEDIPEDEIRIRSHEMLENEDMQHLLRVFSMGGHGHGHGHASFNINENNYAYSAYTPMTPSPFGFDVDRTRPSGKAVVGWLKLKAALRWGISSGRKLLREEHKLWNWMTSRSLLLFILAGCCNFYAQIEESTNCGNRLVAFILAVE
ncbi:UNVERIFIED_CONTAM: Calmodulin-binding protein 60 B [Sesamum radiatum]|uniref:Calmodulin-binding protein 60 B n=1 Tax=Sesamum radiatum TaxID=300843 RepID=A0AAW2T2S6_SESRA